jgi:hypothetical protein
MQRKDASLAFFLDAITYEKKIERVKTHRKKKLGKKMDMKHDNSVRRRIFYLYDRACRKFKMNKTMWKEYMHFLVKCKSIQKLNVVVSKAI